MYSTIQGVTEDNRFRKRLYSLIKDITDRQSYSDSGLRETITEALRNFTEHRPEYLKFRHYPNSEKIAVREDFALRFRNAQDKMWVGLGIALLASSLTEKLVNIKPGNSGVAEISELFKKDPLLSAFLVTILAPISEEAVFRGIPQVVLRLFSTSNSYWRGVNLLSSGLFAIGHNFGGGKEGERSFSTEYIPIPQFIMGLTFFNITRSEGLIFAIGAHSFMNAMATGAIILGNSRGAEKSTGQDTKKAGLGQISRRSFLKVARITRNS